MEYVDSHSPTSNFTISTRIYYYLTCHDLNFRVLGSFEFSQLWNVHLLSKIIFEWMSELKLPLVNLYTNRSCFSFATLLFFHFVSIIQEILSAMGHEHDGCEVVVKIQYELSCVERLILIFILLIAQIICSVNKSFLEWLVDMEHYFSWYFKLDYFS